jgi:hypothetical protein
MSSLLDEACAILDDFENEIARIRAFYKQTAATQYVLKFMVKFPSFIKNWLF